jgi:hypothetical protein
VVAALAAAKLPLEDAEVKLLAQNTAAVLSPRLEVERVEPWGDRSGRVRIGCAVREQCLPFYVRVNWPDAVTAKAALQTTVINLRGHSEAVANATADPASRITDASKAWSPVAPTLPVGERADQAVKSTPKLDAAADSESIVKIGSHATLVIDAQRLHIKLPVICLEQGAPGQTIRVTALDRKQTYKAEVIGSTLLKGTL